MTAAVNGTIVLTNERGRNLIDQFKALFKEIDKQKSILMKFDSIVLTIEKRYRIKDD